MTKVESELREAGNVSNMACLNENLPNVAQGNK